MGETTDSPGSDAPTDPEAARAEPEPEPEPTLEKPATGAIGDTIEIIQGDESVGAVTVASVETSNRPYDEYGEGPMNGIFVIFTVDVEADASFDVPTEHGRLAFAPNYDGGPIGVWEF